MQPTEDNRAKYPRSLVNTIDRPKHRETDERIQSQGKHQESAYGAEGQTPGLIAPPSLWGWPLRPPWRVMNSAVPELLPKSLDVFISCDPVREVAERPTDHFLSSRPRGKLGTTGGLGGNGGGVMRDGE